MGRVTTYETTIAPQPPEGGVDTQVKIINYVYDTEKDQLTSVNLDNSTLSYEYDGGLLLSESSSGYNSKLEWVYDNDLRIKEIKLGNSSTNHSYNDDNQLTSAGDMSYAYDNNGFLTQSSMDSFNETYDYNDYGEVVSVNNGKHDFSYTYDGAGRIKTINNINNTEYFYDMQGRIEKVIKDNGLQPIEEYTYDASFSHKYQPRDIPETSVVANGNRLTANFDSAQSPVVATYDAQDRMLTYGDNLYTYTLNGALLTKSNAEGITEYSYDAMGNLLRVVLPDSRVISYQIDARGRRIGKSIDGVFQYGFIYGDQLNPIAKVDESGNILEEYIYGLRSNVPEYIEKDGVKYKIISDHLGSPLAVWQEGVFDTPVLSRKYDSFGNILEESGSFEMIFGFAGGIWDKDTELVRFGVRDYDSETGRWTSKEPLGFAGARNFYVYAGNDVVNWVDLDGLKIGDPFVVGGSQSNFDIYTAIKKAAIDALQEIICDSIKGDGKAREIGASIDKNRMGTYYIAKNKTISNKFDSLLTPTSKWFTKGTVHTHPCDGGGYISESFSDSDMNIQTENLSWIFIGTVNGNIRVWHRSWPKWYGEAGGLLLNEKLDLKDCECPLEKRRRSCD